MDGVAGCSRLRFWVTATVTATVVVLPVYLLHIRPIIGRISRRRKSKRPHGLDIISEPDNADDVTFEIVAVHGLGADSEHTWTAAAVESPDPDSKDRRRIHLLRDLLKHDFPSARILAFAHNSDWLIDAPVTTAHQIGHRMLVELANYRSKYRRVPIIFIGHSFGGIIIKEALCRSGDTARDIVDSTSGIIFLGTPHQGSLVSTPGAILAWVTGALGSQTGLLVSLMSCRPELDDLDANFHRCMKEKEQRTQKTEIIAFCEQRSTYFAGISLVSVASARGCHGAEPVSIDTDHSGLNKCRSTNDELYVQLKDRLSKLSKNTTTTLNGNQTFVINKLRKVEEAPFNSSANQHDPTCHDETRHELLQEIHEWTDGPITGQHIYWLQGKAGTGKSTIARTVACKLEGCGILGASFFFKRNESGRADAGYLFSTIVAQLARRLPATAEHMRHAIETEPEIANMAFQAQFRELIVKPMIKSIQARTYRTMTVVIDALDECDRPDDAITIIKLLLQTELPTVAPLKFFITSRYKFPILSDHQGIQSRVTEFLVHDIPPPIVERDIAAFLTFRLGDIRKEFNMTSTWPGQPQFQRLLKRSVPLFIFAATACRFIEERRQGGGPQGRLQKILQNEYQGQLDQIYLPILNHMISGLSDSATRTALKEFDLIVGSIITLADPLGVGPLAKLLSFSTDCIEDRLYFLHSVLDIPPDFDSPVKIFHESFRDFLVHPDSEAGAKFQVDVTATHKMLARKCISLLGDGGVLKRDICGLGEAAKERATIDPQVIEDKLPKEARYAVLYWVHHLKRSAVTLHDEHIVLQFLRNHLLHWLEALSLLGRISESIKLIGDLQVLYIGNRNSTISEFLYDAKRFILQTQQIADHAPLQIYCSGLIFAPKKSIVRRDFGAELPSWMRQLPEVQEDWSAVLQNLDGHSKGVGEVAFSPDGAILASAAFDGTVRLWDTSTGTLRQILNSPFRLNSVTFSPNGLMLGSGCYGAVQVHLWDTETGNLLSTLEAPGREGWSASVNSVAFADNRIMASGTSDGRILIWDTMTGNMQRIIDGHSDRVNQVVFSPEVCHMLFSGSADKTVRLWDTKTGTLKQTFEGHSETVNSVAFSSNQHIIASGSKDKTVRLWDTASGTLKSTFHHPDSVNSVSFSPDGQTLASSCDDKEVHLWDTVTYTQKHNLRGNACYVQSVTFSPDNQMLASSSFSNTVQLWDTSVTGNPQPEFLKDYVMIYFLIFSPNGQQLAAGWVSPFGHKMVQLWDTSNGDLRWKYPRIERESLVFTIAFSPNSQMLVYAFRDATMELWDLKTGTPMLRATLNGHFNTPSDHTMAFSPNTQLLAYCASKATIDLCDTATGTLQRTLEGHSSEIISVAFTPNSQILAAASKDKTVRLWNTASGVLEAVINGSSDFEGSLAFSPSGRILISSSAEKTIQLWDIETGALRSNIGVHYKNRNEEPRSVVKALSHDGRMVASGSDTTIRLWDIESAILRQTWRVKGHLTYMEFAPDDSSLKTDLGSFDIDSQCDECPGSPDRKLEISLQDERWISLNGQRVLFLPPEARPDSSATWVVWDQKLVLGLYFGEVFFLEFDAQSIYQ